MSTLAVDTALETVLGERSAIGIIGSDTVFEGAIVGENSVGYGRPLTAGDKFVGHALEQVANESGSAGDKNIPLLSGRYRLEVALVALITDVGQPVYASDDAVLTMLATSNSYVGVVTRYVSATRMEVEFRPGDVDEFGPNLNRITKAVDFTTTATENGETIYVTVKDKAITLIATVAGYRVRVVNAVGGTVGGANNGMVVDFNASDLNLGGCGMAAGGDGKKLTNTSATAKRGDYLEFIGDGDASGGWNLVDKRGIWAQET